jgi:ribose 5-phosphate isomerase B
VSSDHGGFDLKNEMVGIMQARGLDVTDLGAHKLDPNDDYPDFAALVGRGISNGDFERGIIFCGSGVGASIVANKIRGVRAAICHDTYSAAQGVQHDGMNVLALGARIVGPALAQELIIAFLNATLDTHPRFERRLGKLHEIENESRLSA